MELFLFAVTASLVIGWLGRNKKFGFWGYFFCSLALTPFVGLIVLFASDAKNKNDNRGGDAASPGTLS